MAHSVPDAVGIAIETPAGRVFHTGDWKLDHTPVDGLRTDVGKLAELGNRGVDLLCGDSTNAERPGFTQSERVVGEAFRQIIPVRQGRVLVSSFASNIHRMQQAIDVAVDCDRARGGRRPLDAPQPQRRAQPRLHRDRRRSCSSGRPDLDDVPPHEQLVLCTGSQGEPLSALTRIAYNDHPAVHVERGDTVIISARPVPGNELRVHDAINRLTRNGAEVLHEENAPVHVSGHARAEELRTLLGAHPPEGRDADPRRVPDAGRARAARAGAGVPAASIVIAENGDVVELSKKGVGIAGKVEAGVTFVDGLGRRGHLRCRAARPPAHVRGRRPDRRRDAVRRQRSSAPELISRGFAESDELLAEMREEAHEIVRDLLDRGRQRDQAAAGAPARRDRAGGLRPHTPPPDDPARGGRGLSVAHRGTSDWAERDRRARGRGRHRAAPDPQLVAVEVSSLAFCRLLERWARGEPDPSTPGRRQAALRRAADRVETALTGLELPARPLPARARGRLRRGPVVVRRAGAGRARRLGAGARPRRRAASQPHRVAAAYLELAVFVRALEGLSPQPSAGSRGSRSASLWAGLFDLRENLLGRALDDLRAIAA